MLKPQLRAAVFDIDGTLILTGGAGMAALETALRMHLPVSGARVLPEGYTCAGKTDTLIIRDMYKTYLGRLPSQAESGVVEDAYIRELKVETEARRTEYQILPGVEKLIDFLARRGVLIGLGTGNLERAARYKLSFGNIFHHFQFGGYGSDSPERSELLQTAVTRARAMSDVGISMKEVLFLGDTIRDITAVKEIGGIILAVATGPNAFDGLDSADGLAENLASEDTYRFIESNWELTS